MARLILTTAQIRQWARGEILSRSRLTLQIYRKQRLERDRSNYPFARHPEDGSIRDASSSSVRPTARGARITVQSRGAPYIEEGNGPGMITGDPLAIPLLSRAAGARRAKRRGGRSGRVSIGEDGKAYLFVPRVRSYRGQKLLERSARQAFGAKQVRRPPLH